jgi:predicted N-acetyltransferase YhbS
MKMANQGSEAMIELLPEQTLTPADESQIANLLKTSFPTDYGGRSFYKQRPHSRLIWRDGGIVSHAALFYRAIRLGGALVDVMGIGDVATASEARGRGIATDVIAQSIGAARASEARFLILFGARGLYDRAGFQTVPNHYTHVEMVGAKTGVITRADSAYFKVLPLRGMQWPTGVEVDFMGTLF